MKTKEKGLCDLLNKTEQELKTIKSEVFQLFVSFFKTFIVSPIFSNDDSSSFSQNTSTIPEIKNVHGQMKTNNEDLQSKYQNLVADYNKLIDENRTLCEIKNDTIAAIEIFKKLHEESNEREKCYEQQLSKLQMDKTNLHKDRSRLTKQLLSKHRDMIILNSEIDKFRDPQDYECR